jgi:hypothetical protein
MAPPFLISALDEGGWSDSRPCHATHWETACGTLCFGGPQSRSRRYGVERSAFPFPGIESLPLGSSGRSLVALPTELFRLQI